MNYRDSRGPFELAPAVRGWRCLPFIALAALGLPLTGCTESSAETPPEANVAAAAAVSGDTPAPKKKEAKVDPAALYDPPTADVEPPEVFGKRQSAPDFPDVVLTDHNGKEVHFYEELVKGKIVFINFMYATCTGT